MQKRIKKCPKCGVSSKTLIYIEERGRCLKAWRTRVYSNERICPHCRQLMPHKLRKRYVCLFCGYKEGFAQ